MDPSAYRTVQNGVSPFWASKYARESSKNWDKFYRRNKTNFFRDRRWTTTESTDGFPCLAQSPIPPENKLIVIEAGCGVANCAFPLLEANPSLFIYAFDFAPSAIQLVKEREGYENGRCRAFVWDFCTKDIMSVSEEERNGLNPGLAHYCMLIFVLSAVPPDKQLQGLKHLVALLKPGGKLLFRDYATGDMAQKRFANRSKITENYFVRQDSTLSFFFDEEGLHTLLTQAGLRKETLRRVNRVVTNRKENLEMQRVFIQAIYVKD